MQQQHTTLDTANKIRVFVEEYLVAKEEPKHHTAPNAEFVGAV